jgi:hypothetical protein
MARGADGDKYFSESADAQRSPEGFAKLLPAPGDWTPLVMEQP